MTNKALVIVDVQNDFCPGGTLPVPNGDSVVPILNRYIELFRKAQITIFASRDWHPEKTSHFKAYGGIWPVHCVQEAEGARFHPDLKLPADATIISKGMNPDRDDYSAFDGITDEGIAFPDELKDRGITHIFVGGLATDYCVKETVLAAIGQRFRVTVLTDACRGVDLTPGDSERAVHEMKQAGATMTTIDTLASTALTD